MSATLIFLIYCAAFVLWFALSFVFIPLGGLIYKIWKNVSDIITGKKTNNKKNNKEEQIYYKESEGDSNNEQ